MIEITEIVANQCNITIQNCNIAKEIIFPKPHQIVIAKLSTYNKEMLENDFLDIEYKKCIYIITAEKFTLKQKFVSDKFKRLKETYGAKNYHCSKINYRTINNKNNEVLYVGSKENKLYDRLSQHLGIIKNSGRSTYSLYLKDWWEDHSSLTITIWNLTNAVTSDVLQIIEDSIWEELRPLFGKKGSTFNKIR